MVASPTPDGLINGLVQRLNDLQGQINNLRAVAGNAGTTATTYYPHADGSPQRIPLIADEQGHWRVAVWDPSNPASQAHQKLFLWDANSHYLLTEDTNGGWATPWLNVPLYPYFLPYGQPPSANGEWNSYASIATSAAGMATGNIMWEGRIPYVSHPRIAIDGVWGVFGGATNVSYALYVGGTNIGTWTSTGVGAAPQGPWDISALLGQIQVSVQLVITAWTGAGVLACQPLGCYLRGT